MSRPHDGHATSPSGEVPLARIMSETSAEMRHSFASAMASFSHSLTKGEAAEETVRSFLRKRLPSSIAVAKGQVIDSLGQRSKQLDVIIYDAAHTPILFTSEESDNQLIPSEGVLAVIEVKSHINPSDAAGIIANMTSVKSLDKTAYYAPAGMVNVMNMYGRTYMYFPTLYFLFAYDAGDLESVASTFNSQLESLDVDKRLDSACILSKGVLINRTQSGFFDGIPGPNSNMYGYPTENSLLFFYILITRFLFQATMHPIELRRYIPDDFKL